MSKDIFIFANGFFINIISIDRRFDTWQDIFFVNLFLKKSIPLFDISYLIIKFNNFI
jgi:hypothetical protein